MADMKVAMTLTLQDLATVKLERFSDALKAIQDQLAPINDQMKAFQEGMNALGDSVNRSLAPFRSINRSLRQTVAVMGDAGDAAKGMADSMAAAADGAARVGAASAGAAVGIAAVGDSADLSRKKVEGMHGALKGLAEIYVAMKLGEGTKSSVESGAHYQNVMTQLRNLNLPRQELGGILQDARQWRRIPGVSKLTALEAAKAAVAGAPGSGAYQERIRQEIMPQILKAAVYLKNVAGDKSSVHDIVRNLLGIVETRGKLQNLAAAQRALDAAFKIYLGTDDKVTLNAQETALRNMGYGAAPDLSTSGYILGEAVHEQFKASGHGGGAAGNTKAGTIETMTMASAMGGKMNVAQAMMLEQFGLLSYKNVRKIPGSSQVMVAPNSILDSQEALRNPFEWVRNVLIPHVKLLTHQLFPKLKGDAFRKAFFDELVSYAKSSGGVNVGTGYVDIADTKQWLSIKQRAEIIQHTAGIQQASARAAHNLNMQYADLKAKMHTLAVEIGTALLPMVTDLASMAKTAASALGALNRQFPIFQKLEGWGMALGAIFLGIKGIAWLTGIREGFLALKAVRLGSIALSWAADFTGLGGQILGAGMAARDAGAAIGGILPSFAALRTALFGLAAPITGIIAMLHSQGLNKGEGKALKGAEARASVMGTLMGMGLSKADAAAFAGNFKVESNFNPAAIGDHGQAYGIAQWHPDRQALFQKEMGRPIQGSTVQQQLQFAVWEFKHQYAGAWAKFQGAKTPYEKAAIMTQIYEAPANMQANIEKRGSLADQYYKDPTVRLLGHAAHHILSNTALAASRAREHAREMAINSHTLGYTGPVTAAGIAKAAALAKKHVEAAQKIISGGENKLTSAFAHKIALGERYAAKLNEIADRVHIAWLAITNPLNAKIVATRAKYSALSGQLLAGGHTNAAKEALQVGHHQVLQYQYQGAMQHLTALKGDLHQGLTNTAALVTAGSLTKMQAAQQTIQMQKQAAPAMIQAADAAMKYAKALGDPKLVQALQEQKAKLQAMGAQLGYYSAKVRDTMQHSMTGLFENMMHGQKTWGQMFASFFASIGKSLEDTLAKSISQAIAQSLMGKKANQGIGSIFSWLTSGVTSLFGGSGSGVAVSGSAKGPGLMSDISAGGSFLKDIFSVIGSFAVGADNVPNDMVAQIHKGEMIIPAGPAEAIRSGAGVQHHHSWTINAVDSKSFLDQAAQVHRELATMVINATSHLNLNEGY